MTENSIIGSDITPLQLERFRALAAQRGGHVNQETFQAYLDRREIFPLKRDAPGHLLVTFLGRDLCGREENARARENGLDVSYKRGLLLEAYFNEYDRSHRLEEAREYTMALLPYSKVGRMGFRSTDRICIAAHAYGYGKPRAGHAIRLFEALTRGQMIALDLKEIVIPHRPIANEASMFRPEHFCIRLEHGKDPWLGVKSPGERDSWRTEQHETYFAFQVGLT